MWKRRNIQIKKGNEEKKREEKKNKRSREREREKKKVFRFSLRSTKIGLSIFVGVRGKVGPRNKGYTWVPNFRSFIKPQEVGNFLTLVISSLKVI